jgi:hypothetical protein
MPQVPLSARQRAQAAVEVAGSGRERDNLSPVSLIDLETPRQ